MTRTLRVVVKKFDAILQALFLPFHVFLFFVFSFHFGLYVFNASFPKRWATHTTTQLATKWNNVNCIFLTNRIVFVDTYRFALACFYGEGVDDFIDKFEAGRPPLKHKWLRQWWRNIDENIDLYLPFRKINRYL